jgi:hypothetical protein
MRTPKKIEFWVGYPLIWGFKQNLYAGIWIFGVLIYGILILEWNRTFYKY